MATIAVIPARSGSKGMPDKNIANLNGKSLIEWAVNVGVNSPSIDEVYISTDSKKYEQIALNAGARSLGLRPAELANDDAKTSDVIIELIRKLKISVSRGSLLVLLQPTCPIRSTEEIERAITLIKKDRNANSLVTISALDEPHPYKVKKVNEEGYLESFVEKQTSEVARQKLPKAYYLTGAIYITRISKIIENKSLLVEPIIPFQTEGRINIDSQEDFDYLSYLLAKGQFSDYVIK